MFSEPKWFQNGQLRPVWVIFLLCLLCVSGVNAQDAAPGSEGHGLWATNFLEAGQTQLPAASWINSDEEGLLALTREARTRQLSPVEQVLMRRLVLSAADAPEGDAGDALLAARARLMFQIGEASAAAQLLPTLETAPAGFDAGEIAVDLQLAIGQTEAACLSGAGNGEEGVFWAKLRAVCFALENNFDEAELAMELAGSDGQSDDWLARAIFAAAGARSVKPEARFDSGMSLAISAKAGLEPSVRTIANSRLDLAAAIARQDTFNPAMRVQAAGVAAEAGLLSSPEHRVLYKALVEQDGFTPRTALEVAVQTSFASARDIGARARTLRAALQTAKGTPARFSAVSRLLLPDLEAIPVKPEHARMAFDFALAAIAAEDYRLASKWATLARNQNKFQADWLVGIILLVERAEAAADPRDLTLRLLQNAKSVADKARVGRLFTLWHATGFQLAPQARAFLTEAEAINVTQAKRVNPDLLTAISAGAQAGAGAEVILQLVSEVRGDASKLVPADSAVLIEALQTLEQTDAARLLALEATGYWRAPR